MLDSEINEVLGNIEKRDKNLGYLSDFAQLSQVSCALQGQKGADAIARIRSLAISDGPLELFNLGGSLALYAEYLKSGGLIEVPLWVLH